MKPGPGNNNSKRFIGLRHKGGGGFLTTEEVGRKQSPTVTFTWSVWWPILNPFLHKKVKVYVHMYAAYDTRLLICKRDFFPSQLCLDVCMTLICYTRWPICEGDFFTLGGKKIRCQINWDVYWQNIGRVRNNRHCKSDIGCRWPNICVLTLTGITLSAPSLTHDQSFVSVTPIDIKWFNSLWK